MRNIELKARYDDLDKARACCREVAAAFQGNLIQVDTYFHVPEGRLKLRQSDPGPDYLVYYRREDAAKARPSEYTICEIESDIRSLLKLSLGVRCVVTKRRELWLFENVRIHLDDVQDLGTYLEFEAVLDSQADDGSGFRSVGMLRDVFCVADSDLISASYSDLLLALGEN